MVYAYVLRSSSHSISKVAAINHLKAFFKESQNQDPIWIALI